MKLREEEELDSMEPNTNPIVKGGYIMTAKERQAPSDLESGHYCINACKEFPSTICEP